MNYLESVEAESSELEVYECVCGFRLGLDATYLEQVGDIVISCPACRLEAKVEAFDEGSA